MKISVLMPAYNDAKTITASIESARKQSYVDWELIVINDGSSDETEEIVQRISDKRIRYIYQENADQLNALLTGSKEVTGDLVCLLHADDLLPEGLFKDAITVFQEQKPDGVYGDLQMFGGRKTKVRYNKRKRLTPFSQYAEYVLRKGGNCLYDHFFVTKKIFDLHVVENYIKWNKTYWIDYANTEALNLVYLNREAYKYRVLEKGNRYFQSEIGLLNRLAGNLQVITSLSNSYYIPFLKLQSITARILRKIRVNGSISFFPFYKKRATSHKEFLLPLLSLLRFRGHKKNSKNPYIQALIHFYSNYRDRVISLPEVSEKDVFFGKDMRRFNTLLLENKLPAVYYYIFQECGKGFSAVTVKNDGQRQLIKTIFQYLCLKAKIIKEGE